MKHYKEDFIKRCCRGDKLAQRRLFDELYAPMFRIVYRYINKQQEAEDCVMQGFMKVYRNIEKLNYNGEHSLFA